MADSLSEVPEAGETFASWQERVLAGEIALDAGPVPLETIFRNNIQQAHNRGRYEQQARIRGDFPFSLIDEAPVGDTAGEDHVALGADLFVGVGHGGVFVLAIPSAVSHWPSSLFGDETMLYLYKVRIMGTGQVGMAAASALFRQRIANELILVALDRRRAEGEAMDLMHAQGYVGRRRVRAGDRGLCGPGRRADRDRHGRGRAAARRGSPLTRSTS